MSARERIAKAARAQPFGKAAAAKKPPQAQPARPHDAPSASACPARHLIPLFRKAVALRNEMRSVGIADDRGSIQTAEQILVVFGLRLNYPGVADFDHLKDHPDAEFSPAARQAHRDGQLIVVIHALPLRELTCAAIDRLSHGASGEELVDLVRERYRLRLLTPAERDRPDGKAH